MRDLHGSGNLRSGSGWYSDPRLPVFETALLVGMVKSAVVLAVLGSIDSLLTSLVADNLTRSYHDSNRELVGQGIDNTIAGLFGGLPGAGATMRTVVNIRAAVSMMFAVLFITVFVDLVTAVAVGMIMASFVFMQRMSDLQLNSLTTITETGEESPLSGAEAEILQEARGRILLYHIGGPMSFGAAKGMARRLAGFDQYDAIVVDLSDVPRIDFTSARALDDIIHDATDKGRHAFLAGCCRQVDDMLKKQGVVDRFNEDHLYDRRVDALDHALKLIRQRQAS